MVTDPEELALANIVESLLRLDESDRTKVAMLLLLSLMSDNGTHKTLSTYWQSVNLH